MSMKTDSVCGVIVAAGSGTRMGGVSKPEIKLNGKTLFERVLEAFLASPVDEIVVVGGENLPRLRLLAGRYSPAVPLRFCEGGKTRSESVFAGVCQASPGVSYACVHDCARPFVTSEIISAVIEGAKKTGAATACSPVTDTIKFVDTEHKTVYTPKRDHLLAIQTPQVFKKESYTVAYALAVKQGGVFTDETSMLEAAGATVEYVQTDPRNIKLTTKEDIVLARAMLLVEKAKEQSV
ncbi:MAG: 2-C-methyl-D-erythritol 4-phosphate cytidylyltransferase [Clostridia bacterium]|nr:2-C-methyl-D-erythritol 4-phosphate cytidylyltransferase [Clostridia bacterium]